MIDELISMESISLARFKTTTPINGAITLVNIFQNIEIKHTYVYALPDTDQYFIYFDKVLPDQKGGSVFATPTSVRRIDKTEYKKVLKFINSGSEISLTKERIINMAQNKFFIENQDAK